MRAAGKTIDLIFFIHRNRRHFLEGPALRQLSPALNDFVAKFSAPNDHAHTNLLVLSPFRVSSLEFRAKPKPETRKLYIEAILFRLMLIHLPPCFEAAAHTRDVFEAVFNEVRGRAKTAVTVVAVDNDRGLFVGVLDKFLNIAIIEMQRAGYVRRAIRSGIANIDKDGRFLFQLLFRLMYLDLGNIYHRSQLLVSGVMECWSIGVLGCRTHHS